MKSPAEDLTHKRVGEPLGLASLEEKARDGQNEKMSRICGGVMGGGRIWLGGVVCRMPLKCPCEGTEQLLAA